MPSGVGIYAIDLWVGDWGRGDVAASFLSDYLMLEMIHLMMVCKRCFEWFI